MWLWAIGSGAPRAGGLAAPRTPLLMMFLGIFRLGGWYGCLPLVGLIILGGPRPLGMDFGMVYEGFSIFVMKNHFKRKKLL